MSSKKRFSFGRKKKDSSNLEEGFSNLNLASQGSQGGGNPVTPAPRRAPSTSHQQELVRTQPGSQLPRHSAAEILLEHLILCEPNTKFSARLNKVAEKEGYHNIGWETKSWKLKEMENGKTFEGLFVQAITRHEAQMKAGDIAGWKFVNYFPQVDKLLVLEGDVGDSVLSNVLNPLVDIFNLFIHSDYKHRLQVVIRSQHDAQSSKLDHAIYLTEILPSLGEDYEHQIPIVCIEEKAPGIVRERDWLGQQNENWVGKLLPQLLLYAHRAKCSRFFLTNYSESIGVRIDLDTLESAVKDLVSHGKRVCHQPVKIQVCSATREFSRDSNEKLPSDYGFRMGLASEVYVALMELGIVDLDLIDTALKGKAHVAMNNEIANYLKKPLPHPRRDSESPSAGRERLPYSAPPPSP